MVAIDIAVYYIFSSHALASYNGTHAMGARHVMTIAIYSKVQRLNI